MSTRKINAVRGMNDLLPSAAAVLEHFERLAIGALRSYGYRQIRTPVVEPTAVFRRSLGEVTDIVEKEMYTFVDSLNGESLTLRPENTAGVVRATIEHSLLHDGPCRLWYYGPMYRHERPQRGRYREFFQIGAEALGFAGPEVEVEQILLLQRLWRALDLGPVGLQLNTLGQPDERMRHRLELVAFLQANRAELDADAQRRIETNPLRILDSKHPGTQACLERAPRLMDFLGEGSLSHFERVQQLLRQEQIAFQINPRLVRGLDYYNLTVFEWVTDRLGAQGTICGGGRYDGLFEVLGGRPTPACGFSIGVERVLELLGERVGTNVACDIYVLHQGGPTYDAALRAAERLRDAGMDVILHADAASLKSQMRKADASGAEFAVIIGVEENAEASATVKALRTSAEGAAFGQQQRVPIDELAPRLVDALCAEQADCEQEAAAAGTSDAI
ncbi:MAG TPA: histidine--tRNA ligase [Burkholderiaceae bacterium]|nr:histidine--tRNA ligase [Burkholderiaceae bacterium]